MGRQRTAVCVLSMLGCVSGAVAGTVLKYDAATTEIKTLIERDPKDPDKLAVVESSLIWLTSNFPEPVDVISVIGGYHTGKSFLLNQLTGMGPAGFNVTDSVDPTTAGIQMTSTALHGQQILWLDTEGFAAAENSGDYDAKLFAVAATLSSHLLYNSISNINQNDITYLEQLARRAQLFAMKVGVADPVKVGIANPVAVSTSPAMKGMAFNNAGEVALPGPVGGALSLPPLWWIVQSFHMRLRKGETTLSWLDRMLDESAYAIDGGPSSLKAIFTHRQAHTLYLPAASEKPEAWEELHATPFQHLSATYQEQLGALQRALLTAVALPRHGSAVAKRTGREIADFVRILVRGANEGKMAALPSLWQMMIEAQVSSAVDEATALMKRRLRALEHDLPLTSAAFVAESKVQKAMALKSYSDALFGLRSDLVKAKEKRLSEELENLCSGAELANNNRIREVLDRGRKSAVETLKVKHDKIVLPQPRKALDGELAAARQVAMDVLKDEVPRDYGAMLKTANKELLNEADAKGRAMKDKNNDAIKKIFDDAKKAASREYHAKMGRELGSAQSEAPTTDSCHVYTEFVKVEAEANSLGLEAFEKNLGFIKDENEATEKRNALRSELRDAVSKYVQWEGGCVTKLARAEGEALAERRLKDDYEKVLRQACPMDKKSLSKTMDAKEAEDVAALRKTMAPFVSSDHPTKVYKAALESSLVILREGLGRARTRMDHINTDAWAKFVERPLDIAAKRIRDYNRDASSLTSPLSSFNFRAWSKARAMEEMDAMGDGRISRAQLEEVLDAWLSGTLDVSSSKEMREIVEMRESYATLFSTLALAAACIMFVVAPQMMAASPRSSGAGSRHRPYEYSYR